MIKIIIPNFNGEPHLKECLDSLRKQTFKEFSILLVDNNSIDNSVNFVKQEYPEVEVLQLQNNEGFAKAINEGIKKTLSDEKIKYFILLNNDVKCDENFVLELFKSSKIKGVGAVAPKMLNYFNPRLIDSVGDGFNKWGHPIGRGSNQPDSDKYNKSIFVTGVCAGAALYTKEIFEKVGFFDEDFFAFFEDVDFNLRLQSAGYKCYYNPKAICYHKRGATIGDKHDFHIFLCERNLVLLRFKNYPLTLYIYYQPIYLLVRIYQYLKILRKFGCKRFFNASKGFLCGILSIPKNFQKRKNIQKNRIISIKYFRSLLKEYD